MSVKCNTSHRILYEELDLVITVFIIHSIFACVVAAVTAGGECQRVRMR
jgi:hypothetical protein